MSDILEDQTIHYIVKDYKRMAEQHDQLVAIGKEFQSQLIAKEKELANVKARLEEVKAELEKVKASRGETTAMTQKAVKNKLGEMESRAIGAFNKVEKMRDGLEGIIANINDIRKLLENK